MPKFKIFECDTCNYQTAEPVLVERHEKVKTSHKMHLMEVSMLVDTYEHIVYSDSFLLEAKNKMEKETETFFWNVETKEPCPRKGILTALAHGTLITLEQQLADSIRLLSNANKHLVDVLQRNRL